MLRFTEFLSEAKDVKFDDKKHRWITVKDKQMQNQHIMLNKKDGTIAAGMGGKHNGDTLDDVYDDNKKDSKEVSKETPKESPKEKSSAPTEVSKKPSMKKVRDSISDESLKKINKVAKDLDSFRFGGKYPSDISKIKSNISSILYKELPKNLRKGLEDEYEDFVEGELMEFKKTSFDIQRLANISQNIKDGKKLSVKEKELFNKIVDKHGGIDKAIERYTKRYDDVMNTLQNLHKKCRDAKNDDKNSSEINKFKTDKKYTNEFNKAGVWTPTSFYGSSPKPDEYNEERRKDEIKTSLSYLERDIEDSKGSATISLGDNKKISIDKSRSYSYNGKSIDREQAVKLLQAHKNVSVDTKF